MYQRINALELQALASEVFNRSWQFIERDPVLLGLDRESLQARLAELILVLMRDGECSVILVANRAISMLRQECVAQPEHAA
jgi:hypothetical protein